MGKDLTNKIIAKLLLHFPSGERTVPNNCSEQSQQEIELREGDNVRIGRAPTNDLVLDETKVSRFHAVINVSSSGLLIYDLNSLNGTLVNGARITCPITINSGDQISVGTCTLTVVMGVPLDTNDTVYSEQTQSGELTPVIVTVLVVDVCSYTKISELLPSSVVAQMLSTWLKKMSDIVIKNNGEVDKYIGDCVMALWRGPDSQAGVLAEKALSAAIEMLTKTEDLSCSGHWPYHGTSPWRCRVAINSGEALMGSLGGSRNREYTVLGDTVNVAFRLVKSAREQGVDLVASDATAAFLHHSSKLVSLGKVKVPGRIAEIEIFSLAKEYRLGVTKRDEITVNFKDSERILSLIERQLDRLLNLFLVKEILKRLSTELSPNLFFHSYAHTIDVIEDVVIFASLDNRTEREIELLGLAAAFHDAGFLIGSENHEEHGAAMAKEAMLSCGDYQPLEAALVGQMIMDTKTANCNITQKSFIGQELSRYLLDADLSNLGRKDFFSRLEALAEELGRELVDVQQEAFLLISKHVWLTTGAEKLRSKQMADNLNQLHSNLLNLLIS